MERTVKERLVKFISASNLTQAEFQRRCNLSSGYINNMVDGIGAAKLEQIISEFPHLNTKWLLTGEGEMLKSSVITVTGDNNMTGGNNISIEGKSDDNARVSTIDKVINELSEMRKLLQEQINNNQEQINNNKEQFDRLVSIIEKLTNKLN